MPFWTERLRGGPVVKVTYMEIKLIKPNTSSLGGALSLTRDLSPAIMASSRLASAPQLRHHWAGPRCVGLPAVGHFRRARVSFDSAFKLSSRTSAAASFSAVPSSENNPHHQINRGLAFFLFKKLKLVPKGFDLFCGQKTGSSGTIMVVAVWQQLGASFWGFLCWLSDSGNVMLCRSLI